MNNDVKICSIRKKVFSLMHDQMTSVEHTGRRYSEEDWVLFLTTKSEVEGLNLPNNRLLSIVRDYLDLYNS